MEIDLLAAFPIRSTQAVETECLESHFMSNSMQ